MHNSRLDLRGITMGTKSTQPLQHSVFDKDWVFALHSLVIDEHRVQIFGYHVKCVVEIGRAVPLEPRKFCASHNGGEIFAYRRSRLKHTGVCADCTSF